MASAKERIKCTDCGIEKKSSDFYKSSSSIFKNNGDGRICICKECLLNLYAKYLEKYNQRKQAVFKVCQKLDVYFEDELYESAELQCKGKSNVCRIYFQKVNSLSQYRNKTFDDSKVEQFDDIDKKIKKIEERIQDDVEYEEFEITRDIINFWGEGFDKKDYEFLTMEYYELCNRFECDSYSQEMLFQEIAHQRLNIKKKRQKSESVDKELKTLQDLLGSANIKPVQETGVNANEQATFGTLIKKWENEKPIPEPLESWTSEDWIKKYVCVWFFGHLCKMMGIRNDMSDIYEKELNNLTVELDGEEQ